MKKAWKCIRRIGVIVGIVGAIIGIVVGIKGLFFGEKIDQVIFEQPRFSEEVKSFSFSLGANGSTISYSKEGLEKGIMEPYAFGEFKPFKLYIENGVLYADISVYAGSNLPPIKIVRDKLSGKPKDWDFNSNKNAIEIVNSAGKPMYQFLYKSASQIVVNGIFPFANGFLIAGPKGLTVIQNANVIAEYDLEPIFRYPSWKYPGEYAK